MFAPPPPSLFNSATRSYEGPRAHSESDYAFLVRSARAACRHARETLDAWYLRLPVAARGSVRARFVNHDPGHHLGALLELYLHEAFLRLDYEIDLDIGQEDPTHRRPDLLLTDGEESFYLEASAVLGADAPGERSNALAAALYEAVDRITAPAFFLSVDIKICGTSTPGRRQVTAPLERWLAELDPDTVLAGFQNTRELPERRLVFDGWDVRFRAIPVSPQHREAPDHRVLGTHSGGVGILDDASPLRAKLKRKAGHYGELGRPYVIALLCAGDFVEDHDIADALLGTTAIRYSPDTRNVETVRQPDGFWHGSDGPQNSRVSAVITLPQLHWHTITTTEPTIWIQPWAAHPLKARLPWRTQHIANDGRIKTTQATRSQSELFELPAGWATPHHPHPQATATAR